MGQFYGQIQFSADKRRATIFGSLDHDERNLEKIVGSMNDRYKCRFLFCLLPIGAPAVAFAGTNNLGVFRIARNAMSDCPWFASAFALMALARRARVSEVFHRARG